VGAADRRQTPLRADLPGTYVHIVATFNLLAGMHTGSQGALPRGLALLAAAIALLLYLSWRGVGGSSVVVIGAVSTATIWGTLAAIGMSQGWLVPVAPVLIGLLVPMGGELVLRANQAETARQQIRDAFHHYLSPTVVEELVADPDKLRLGGRRREITAFFSDIGGFTSISEQLDPAELTALLNEYLSAMTEIVLEEGGTIDKYIGDAIVAMFGAPLDQPDHVDRALRAAQRCQAWLAERRPQLLERGFPEVVVRIGLNSGEAIVGNMGSEQRFDYSMLGDTVNLAARLEGACKFCGVDILIGPKTAAATRGTLVREVDKLQVKGKTEGVSVWSPVSLAADLTADEEAFLEEWELALRAYRSQDWDGAQERLTRMADAGDGPAATLLGRIPGLRESDLPPEWDGVYHLTSK
jgi:adenylate cyclase